MQVALDKSSWKSNRESLVLFMLLAGRAGVKKITSDDRVFNTYMYNNSFMEVCSILYNMQPFKSYNSRNGYN